MHSDQGTKNNQADIHIHTEESNVTNTCFTVYYKITSIHIKLVK